MTSLLHYFTCEICNKDMIDTNLKDRHVCNQCLSAILQMLRS